MPSPKTKAAPKAEPKTLTRAERMSAGAAALKKDGLAAAMRVSFGPAVLQVRKTRVIHWPGTSEIRYQPGELVWAGDPWMDGQVGKCTAYTGKGLPKFDEKAMTRGRKRELAELFNQAPEPEPGTAEDAPADAAQAAKRGVLEAAETGELAGLDG